jgi:RHS repeat-associated protein
MKHKATLASPVDSDDLVDVAFTNDDFIPGGEDRNLYVEHVTVGSQTIPADNRALSYDIVQTASGSQYHARDLYASDGALWFTGALRLTERYLYDSIGNLLNKADLAMTYGAAGQGQDAHRALTFDGQAASYDANGNLLADGLRTYSWDAENRPTSISSSSGAFATESYRSNADGARVRVSSSVETRLYLDGLWEETTTGATRSNYLLNGQAVAVREASGGSSTLTYVHSDQLGSVSVATNARGQLLAQQEYDPWGKVRPYAVPRPTITQTKRNFTGQILDSSGLLHYNARSYDPSTGRFISADTIVPGSAPLTLSPHDAVATAAWGTAGGGPRDPQQLNRYSYALNNPVRNTDPTGHFCVPMSGTCILQGALIGGAVGGPAGAAAGAFAGALVEASPFIAVAVVGTAATVLPSDDSSVDSVSGAEGLPIGETGQIGSGQSREPLSIDDYLAGAPLTDKGKTRIHEKPGGFSDANSDFDALTDGTEVKDQGGGIRSAKLPDGTTISVRPGSSQGNSASPRPGSYPTVQINKPGSRTAKVRYVPE